VIFKLHLVESSLFMCLLCIVAKEFELQDPEMQKVKIL